MLKAIERLPDDWDSHGALRPRADIITGGRALLRSLARFPGISRPYINPTRSGGVQFEWESGPRYFEIELTAPDRAEYYYENREAGRHAEGVLSVAGSLTASS